MFHNAVVDNAEMVKSFLISNGVAVKSLYLREELDLGEPQIKLCLKRTDKEVDIELITDLLEEVTQSELEPVYRHTYPDAVFIKFE